MQSLALAFAARCLRPPRRRRRSTAADRRSRTRRRRCCVEGGNRDLLGAQKHLGAHVLDRLEAADRLAELLADLRVFGGGLQRPPGQPGSLGSEHGRGQILDAPPRNGHDICGCIGEHDLSQRAGEVGGGQRLDRDTIGGGIDEQEFVLGGGQQQHPRGIGAQHKLGGAGCPAVLVIAGRPSAPRPPCARRTPAPPAGRPANSGQPAWQPRWWRSDRGPSRRRPRRPSRTGRRRCRRPHRTLRAAPRRKCRAGPDPGTARATLLGHPARSRGLPRRHWTPRPSYGPVHERQTARQCRSLMPATSQDS